MAKCEVRIVLTEQKSINGKIRNPGYVLLEGICPAKVTANDVNKAIQLKQVKVDAVRNKSSNEKDSEGKETDDGGSQD